MNKKLALLTVFLVVLIDLMGFGIVLPLLPFYAQKFNVSPVMVGFLYSIYSLAQLVFSPIWGGFSDRVGRKPIMIMSTLGAVGAYLLFAFSNTFAILFISRLLAGIMGGNISTAQAYVADVTTHQDRAKGMGLLGAAFGIGFMVGPALATFLIHTGNYQLPGFFAAALSFISFLLVIFCLPETVTKTSVVKSDDPQRVVRSHIFSPKFWKSLVDENKTSRKHVLPFLMFAIFILSMGQSSMYSAFPLFCKSAFNMSAQQVGMQFAYMGLVAVFIQGGLIRQLTKYFSEESLFLVGCVLMPIGFAMIVWASSVLWVTISLAVLSIGASLNGPTLTSLISKEVDPKNTGRAMGSAQGLSALGRVIGPTWGGYLYSASARLPFLLTALLLSVTIYVGLRISRSPAAG